MRDWQRRWHDVYDIDHDLVAAGDFDRPDPLPDDPNRDYRLIFGLSRATLATRHACFEIFPSGPKMHDRFQDFLSKEPCALNESEARTRLQKVTALMDGLGLAENVNLSQVSIVDRDTKEGLELLNATDDITVLLEKSALIPYPVEDLEKVAARLFLTEPLYAAAGNFYHVSNWVTAAMTGGTTDTLHSELYELWAGGWQVALGTDGLILASRRI